MNIAPWPYFAKDEQEIVSDVLQSGQVNYWTGPYVKNFEQEFATYLGAKHAIAVANGTLALELALKALDIGAGDEVIVPCRTFIASASAVVACGATPVITDIDFDTHNVSAEQIIPAITEKTKAIVVVHLSGLSCDMDPILDIAKKHNIKIIEDCAQAHGAKYKGQYCGTIGDIATFSFCQDKIMTTGGEGGMVVTNNKDLFIKSWEYKDHGKSFDKIFNQTQDKKSTDYNWIHDDFGSNYRMSGMQAAIGSKQLGKLNDWLIRRRENASILDNILNNVSGIDILKFDTELCEHAYYKYYFHIDSLKYDISTILARANEKRLPLRRGISPDISREKVFTKVKVAQVLSHPNADKLEKTAIMCVVHPTIDSNAMEEIAMGIADIFKSI